MSFPDAPLFFAILGGVGPTLLWLWFWLREDSHPLPKRLVALAFIVGMITVALVIPLQRLLLPFLSGAFLYMAWAAIEEIMKYIAAWFTVLGRHEADQPIDMVIYMIVVALGFAAAENSLFLLQPMSEHGVVQSILTGNLRFVGATLLHVLSSSAIGAALAFGFYRSKTVRHEYAAVGVVLAILLHSLFNILILKTAESNLFRAFMFVWVGIIILFAVCEYIKRGVRRPLWPVFKHVSRT